MPDAPRDFARDEPLFSVVDARGRRSAPMPEPEAVQRVFAPRGEDESCPVAVALAGYRRR
jgi:hypothetical protein